MCIVYHIIILYIICVCILVFSGITRPAPLASAPILPPQETSAESPGCRAHLSVPANCMSTLACSFTCSAPHQLITRPIALRHSCLPRAISSDASCTATRLDIFWTTFYGNREDGPWCCTLRYGNRPHAKCFLAPKAVLTELWTTALLTASSPKAIC